MAGNDTVADNFEIFHELNLGMKMIEPNSRLQLGDYYRFGNSVQMCIRQENSEFWFSLKQTMFTQGKHYLMLSYPPSTFDGAERIPLALLELATDKSLRTLSDAEAKILKGAATTLANRDAPIDFSTLHVVLGKIPDWEEVKHRL